ncbi:cAMP phosphodiesterases class-II domain-containing protein [Hirsutella rhossiliensis]|uniref:cAMP phosphodiesterases class-II domain-containing protein n=1 Tax=Hirsutella rhossiliensis TaxID=111463 RepID=A0A9P8N317_9HYPO|nr:cAMP phosphodiesterases class-II domain-containing protein [Hirsutella rhossiliensis]KAH0965970.1 cAMP phosphodiesterases class-II domain-containing protein [Hirsutella rhossiliensis]
MGQSERPALQVIVLGSGGGPLESNTTAFLVRSVAQDWSKGSIVAVDAGVHLSAIARLIQDAFPSPPPTSLPFTLTEGPFAGLPLPYRTAAANAAHVTRTLVDTYLITHPHMDHISGFVVNTAGLPGTRPKKLAGLPSTIQAFKNHIFNNVIWPNLSDENNGAGLLTYLRLVDGGSPALGDGPGKGYLEVCDGLLVKTWSVSHGHCIEKHSHRGSASSASPRFGSHDGSLQPSRRDLYGHQPSLPTSRSQTLLGQATLGSASPQFGGGAEQEKYCVYDSSAYFIRDQDHRREVLIFGDVEPDSLSLSPRNLAVWQEAAPKVASGTLAAVFIECSYDDSRCNDRLYGHLKPVFVIEELQVLAAEVDAARKGRCVDSRKRKRISVGEGPQQRHQPSFVLEEPVSPKSMKPSLSKSADSSETPHLATPVDELTLRDLETPTPEDNARRPLEGLKVVIIHVKETLENEPDPGETILQQLREHEREACLGCEYIVSKPGQSLYL